MTAKINQSFKTMCLEDLISKLRKDNKYNLEKLQKSRHFQKMVKEYTEMCSLNIHTYYAQNDIKEAMLECYYHLIECFEGEYEINKKHRNKLKKFYLKEAK